MKATKSSIAAGKLRHSSPGRPEERQAVTARVMASGEIEVGTLIDGISAGTGGAS